MVEGIQSSPKHLCLERPVSENIISMSQDVRMPLYVLTKATFKISQKFHVVGQNMMFTRHEIKNNIGTNV